MKTVALASAFAIVMAMTGCVTIEDQLNSPDPSTRLIGEHQLLTQARQSGKEEEVLNAVKRIQTKPLLLEIAKNANPKRIAEGQEAFSKLTDEKDFATLACSAEAPSIRRMALEKVSQQESLFAICTQSRDSGIRKSAMGRLSPESLARLPYSSALFPYWKKITDQKTLAKIYRDGCGTFSQDDLNGIASKIEDNAVLNEMVIPPSGPQIALAKRNREDKMSKLSETIKGLRIKANMHNRNADHAKKKSDAVKERRERQEAANYITKANELGKQLDMLKGSPAEGLYVTNDTARAVLYGRIKDATVFEKILLATGEDNCPILKTREQLVSVLRRMPEDNALRLTLDKLHYYGTYFWNKSDFWQLELAASLAMIAKDSKTRVRLADAAIGKVEAIKDECRSSLNFRLSWSDKEESAASKYAADFPLSEDERAEIVAMGGLAGRRVAQIVDEETARKVLASGRMLDKEIEKALVEKIPGEKIDIALYESVVSVAAKATLYGKMPESVKKSISTANTASPSQESITSSQPSMKISVGDVNIANINMDDVVAAIRTWQKERWNSDKIGKTRKSKGRVEVDDLKISAHHKDLQPLLDIMVADYVLYVNILDSFVDAQTPQDAVAMLLKSLSLDDFLKMVKALAGTVDSAKSLKDNAGWKDLIPIGKDMVVITAVSASMTNASGILKGIYDQLMAK